GEQAAREPASFIASLVRQAVRRRGPLPPAGLSARRARDYSRPPAPGPWPPRAKRAGPRPSRAPEGRETIPRPPAPGPWPPPPAPAPASEASRPLAPARGAGRSPPAKRAGSYFGYAFWCLFRLFSIVNEPSLAAVTLSHFPSQISSRLAM